MAGVNNKTARQYNCKCIDKKGRRVTVRLAPGLNDVDDDHWKSMKDDPYVKSLKKDGLIDFGKSVDDMVFENEPDTISKSKADPAPKTLMQKLTGNA